MDDDDIVLSHKRPRVRPPEEAINDERHSRWTCSYCGRAFAKAEHYHRHTLTHTKQRPYKCSTCFKSFSRQDTLARHVRTHQRAEDQAFMSGDSILATPPTIEPHPETDVSQNDLINPLSDNLWDSDIWGLDLAAFNTEIAALIAGPTATGVEQRSAPFLPTVIPFESSMGLFEATVEEKWFTYLSPKSTARAAPASVQVGRGRNDLNEHDRTSMRLSLTGATPTDVLPSIEFLVRRPSQSARYYSLTTY